MENKTKTVVRSDVKVQKDVAVAITKNQLINVLAMQKGSTIVQLFSTTDVKMNKGGRECTNYLYGNVIKDSEVSGNVDFEYENSVNNALVKSGNTADFKVGERKWGEHLVVNGKRSRVIIVHTKDNETRYYVQIRINKTVKPTYRYKDSGAVLSETDLAVMKSYQPAKKTELVVLRDYRVDNVKRIHINKAQYIVKPN